jgi:hypothetical protein
MRLLARSLLLALALACAFGTPARGSTVRVLAELNHPDALGVEPDGSLLVAYGPSAELGGRITAAGAVVPLFGALGELSSRIDGPGSIARSCGIGDFALTPSGTRYFTDAGHLLRTVAADGTVTTRIGNTFPGFDEEACPPKGDLLHDPVGITTLPQQGFAISEGVDMFFTNENLSFMDRRGVGSPGFPIYSHGVSTTATGDVYFASPTNNTVGESRADGSTWIWVNWRNDVGVAGDGGRSLDARTRAPRNVITIPGFGFLFTDVGNNRLRSVGTVSGGTDYGIIRTLVGGGTLSPPGGQFAVALDAPSDLQLTPDGLAISEPGANRVLLVEKTSFDATVAPVGTATEIAVPFSSWRTGPTFECRVDSVVWAACTSPLTRTGLADGPHRAEVRATDGDGTDPTPAVLDWTVDTLPPSAPQPASPAAGSAMQAAVSFSWLAATDATSGLDHYVLRVDDARRDIAVSNCTSGTCSAPWPADLVDGAHTWNVTAVDRAGLESAGPERPFTVDTVAPAAPTPAVPHDGQLLAAPPSQLSWNALPATEGAARYEIRQDGREATSVSLPATTIAVEAAMPDGRHTWDVRAVDAAGNRGPWGSASFTIDSTAPIAELHASPANFIVPFDVEFDARASRDAGTGVAAIRFDVDGDGHPDVPSPIGVLTVPITTEGSHSVTVVVTDAVGNEASARATVTGQVRPAAASSAFKPGVSINGGAEYTHSLDVKLAITAPPTATAMLITNGGDNGDGRLRGLAATTNWRLASATSRDRREVQVSFYRGERFLVTGTDSITVDQVPPVVVAASVTRSGGSTRLHIRARDNRSKVKGIKVSAGRHTVINRPRGFRSELTLRAPRQRWIKVAVYDGAGNLSAPRRVKVPR